jgi:hypothetical protein
VRTDDSTEYYEGLVKETAAQIVAGGVELEFDDVRQLLRIKVWRALQRFSVQRAAESRHLSHARDRFGRSPRERFVFMCVANMRKDIEKRPRRYATSIDELRGDDTVVDAFDARYFAIHHDQIYGQVDEGELVLPATLTHMERRVVLLRMEGRLLFEIDRALGLSRAQREKVMQSVRAKLADWHPSPAAQLRTAPMPPLPHAERLPTPARVAQAA